MTSSPPRPGTWELAGLPAPARCLVIGVVNVTPDSFSDGGRWLDRDRAIQHGRQLLAEGADIIDIGGESTRPGADRVDVDEERRRVLPVVHALVAERAVVSVDTMRSVIAHECLDAGAAMINDVSGGSADPKMAAVVGAAGVPMVVMHWRGHSREMQQLASYDDVVAEVVGELAARIDDLVEHGLSIEQVVIDPGLGFAKRPEHNWALLADIEAVMALGRPVLVGASRKSFLGSLLAGAAGESRDVDARDAASAAITALAAARGVWGVRVHEVAANADAVRVVAAVDEAARAR